MALGLMLWAAPAEGQPVAVQVEARPAKAHQPATRLQIHPATAPVPALRYRLLPPLEDRTPGNGAQLYYRVFAFEVAGSGGVRLPNSEEVEAWLNMPPASLPRQELSWLTHSAMLRELDLAARREHVDWELTPRLRTEGGVEMLIPEAAGIRRIANLLALRARLEMAQGQYDKAVRSCQTGLALAHDIADAPLLIQQLVGIAIAQNFLSQLETLMEMPGAPNLYWALSDLPRPFISMRRGLEGETLSLYAMLPLLREVQDGPLSAVQAERLTDVLARLETAHGMASPAERPTPFGWRLAMAGLIAKFYPESKQWLLSQGRRPADVEAMPSVQVVTLYSLHHYFRLRDDILKWLNFPYFEAIRALDRVDEELRRDRRELTGGFPIASLMLPSVVRLSRAPARLDRHLAALRCIEALRLYAAAHEGRPPQRLEEITEVPVPADPVTGKPFVYEVEGNRASLSSPALAGVRPDPTFAIRYELTFSR